MPQQTLILFIHDSHWKEKTDSDDEARSTKLNIHNSRFKQGIRRTYEVCRKRSVIKKMTRDQKESNGDSTLKNTRFYLYCRKFLHFEAGHVDMVLWENFTFNLNMLL